ncbi:MAG TPA: DNA translocase FtsK 4TM domain-containing protein, partial [Nitrolancea sp.]
MAAPARSRTAKRKSTRSSKGSTTTSSNSQTLFSLPRALGRAGTATIRWARMSTIPEQVKREIVAVVTICCAGLLTLSIAGYGGQMSVVGELVEGLRWLVGRGAIFVPIGLAWIAIELMIGTEVGPRRRRLFGMFFFAASIIAFLDLIVVPSGPKAGGKIGEVLGQGSRLVAGDVGAGIICFAVGMIGVYLVTSVHSREVLDSWRRSRDIRQTRAQMRREARAQAAERLAEEQRALAKTKKPSAAPEASVQTAPLSAPSTEAVEQRPVINMPKRRKAAKESDVTTAPVSEPPGEAPAPAPLPDIQKLALYESGSPESSELEGKAELITETLKNFKVDASVREIFPGPAVTLFALEPGPG